MVVIEEVFIVGYYKIQTVSRQTVLQTRKDGAKKEGMFNIWTQQWPPGLQVTRWGGNTPKWEATDKGCALVLWGATQLWWTDTAQKIWRSLTPSQFVTETSLKTTSTLPALHSFILSSIRTNTKEKDVFPSFILNKKKLFPALTFQYCQKNCHN